MPTHRLSLTQTLRQSILGKTSVLSALSGPFAVSLFALLSAVQNSLWMRWQRYFRLKGLLFTCRSPLNSISVSLSSTFFRLPGIFILGFPVLPKKRHTQTRSKRISGIRCTGLSRKNNGICTPERGRSRLYDTYFSIIWRPGQRTAGTPGTSLPRRAAECSGGSTCPLRYCWR